MDSSKTPVIRPSSEEGGKRKRIELPGDLVVEILARLPAKSLLRFRSVSKHWYSLIDSPNFIALHFTHNQRKKKVSLFYSCKRNLARNRETTVSFGFGDVTETLTFEFDISSINIVGCSNGVVCLSLRPQPHKYVLWNPATRQVREIGSPPFDSNKFTSPTPFDPNSGFFLDPVTNAIKVVDIILDATKEGENRVRVHVFSTAINSWTEKKDITVPYPICLSGCRTRIINTTCGVDGYMLWHIAIQRLKPAPTLSFEFVDTYILSYDMNGEVFKRIEIPFRPARVGYQFASYSGSLAVFVGDQTGSNVDVWVLNDCSGDNQSWSKLLTCGLSLKAASIVGFFRKDIVI